MSFIEYDPDAPLLPPIATDPEEIRLDQEAALRARVPGWHPLPTALLTHALAAVAETSAAGRQAFVDRLVSVLTELLGALHDIPRIHGTPASGSLTVTAIDALGHTEPDGLTVYVGDVEMVTTSELIVSVGQSTGQVPVSTVDAGAHANDATGDVDLPLDWLASTTPNVALDAPLAGGSDAETDLEYQLRLIGELAVPRRAVRDRDFVFYARRHPAVGVCWAIAFYDAVTDTAGVPLTVSIIVGDPEGLDLSTQTLAEIQADLHSRTIENLDVIVVNVERQEIDVTATVVLRDDVLDKPQALAAVAARIAEALTPAGHASAVLSGPPPLVIHEHALVAHADLVDDVAYVDELQIGDGSSPSVTLGPTTLPTPGTITVTEAAP